MKFCGMFHDGIDGSLSSKRVVTFSAFVLCAVAFLADLFFNKRIEPFLFDSMSYIAMAGLGATVMEKFSSRTPMQGAYQNMNQVSPISPVSPIIPPTPPTKIRGTPIPLQEQPLL